MNEIQFGDPGNDFIREIKPTSKQEDLLSLPDSIFEALIGGSAYGGKTFILTLLPLIRGFYKFRGFKGIIFRRKFPDLEREIIRLSKEYYPSTGATYNETKHSWEWKDYGSYMDFGHVQHDSDIRMYDSSQYNYCSFDETTHFSEAPYIYMVGSRIRPSSSFNVSIVRNGTNPGGIGHSWVYNRFIKPDENGYKLIKDNGTSLTRIFIPARYYDNPYGLEWDPLYEKKLEILPEAEKRAKKYGDWHSYKGSVFTTFRPIRFPSEPKNALHVIESFEIPEWWPKFITIDWGKRAMCHALWGTIGTDKRVYVYRERAWKGKDVYQWASEIREINNTYNEEIMHVTICGSAWQDRGTETIIDQFREYSKLSASSSDNSPGSRVIGLQLIHDFLRWNKKVTLKSKNEFYDLTKAQEISRRYGEIALEKYRSQFYDEPEEENIPILQIFENCKILIDTIPMAIYDEKKTEDIAEFDGDDPIDNLRYFCKTAKKILLGEVGGLETLTRRNAIIQKVQETGDMTSFYRQMEALERQSGIITTPGMAAVPVAISRRSRFSRRRH